MKSISIVVDVDEVDDLMYGELVAQAVSAEALDVDGLYTFLAWDGRLFVGEYNEEGENIDIWQVVEVRKVVDNVIL